MSQQYRNLGDNYLLEKKFQYKYTSLLALSYSIPFLFIGIYLFWVTGHNWKSLLLYQVPAFAIFWLIALISEIFKIKALQYKAGIKGEQIVAKELAHLPETYMIFKDVNLPGRKWNIDYVVLGQRGICIVETKNVRGVIGYDGKDLICDGRLMEGKSVLKQVREQYFGLHQYLFEKTGEKHFVKPVIALVNSTLDSDSHFASIKDIAIRRVEDLDQFITSQRECYFDFPHSKIKQELQKLVL